MARFIQPFSTEVFFHVATAEYCQLLFWN